MDGKLSGRLSVVHSLSGSLSVMGSLSGRLSAAGGHVDVYDGPMEVVPSQEAQMLATEGKLLKGDIIVAPIPSNYGRITYNGLGITVS